MVDVTITRMPIPPDTFACEEESIDENRRCLASRILYDLEPQMVSEVNGYIEWLLGIQAQHHGMREVAS